MKRCLELARKGFGKVAPNPMVGCVIVYKDKIIGEGYHRQYGSAHAEVNAISSVKKKDIAILKRATLYVNLEPCSHIGKTPPCADLIIKTGFKYVVIGTVDPNPLVKGKGLQKLVSSGCDVKVGQLENECRELNKRFFTFHEKKRPHVILKWAETCDHYIGMKGAGPLQISGREANILVHQWRAEESAILVGTNTALSDDPQLTVRSVKGKNPLRVALDRRLRIPGTYRLLDGSVPTLIFASSGKPAGKNIEYVEVDFKKGGLRPILTGLYKRQIQSVIVEGGSKLLRSFVRADLWDEARFFISNKSLSQITRGKGVGVKAPNVEGRVLDQKRIGQDFFFQIQ